ncbi:MAG: hypothetical protein IPL22_19505 [Bacteroidetes bacterium]|nr:hypothetical protein [Bacteroidota bacterium]
MKRIIKLIFAFLMFPSILLSQGINNLWMMGKGGSTASLPLGGMDMDFISGTPVISYLTREMEFRRGIHHL